MFSQMLTAALYLPLTNMATARMKGKFVSWFEGMAAKRKYTSFNPVAAYLYLSGREREGG